MWRLGSHRFMLYHNPQWHIISSQAASTTSVDQTETGKVVTRHNADTISTHIFEPPNHNYICILTSISPVNFQIQALRCNSLILINSREFFDQSQAPSSWYFWTLFFYYLQSCGMTGILCMVICIFKCPLTYLRPFCVLLPKNKCIDFQKYDVFMNEHPALILNIVHYSALTSHLQLSIQNFIRVRAHLLSNTNFSL